MPVHYKAPLNILLKLSFLFIKAALTVLCIKQAIVIGPTPPGTGVILSTISKTLLKLTSPTNFDSLLLVIDLVNFNPVSYTHLTLPTKA